MARALVVGARDLTVGPFRCSQLGLTVSGRPSYDAWLDCGRTLARIEGAVQWWIGDWLNYGRRAYGDKYREAVEAIGLDQSTLENYAYTAGNLQTSRRRENLSFTAHSEIVRLPTADDQNTWLDRAERGDGGEPWSAARLRRELRIARLETRQPSALPGVFDVLCADPPWAYDNSGFDQSAAAQYPTLDVDTIAALPETDPTFPKIADPAVLFLWCTSPLLPAGVQVVEAWGFDYKASMIWEKDAAPGIGWWVRTRHELLLIGVRGDESLHPSVTPDSVVPAATRRHSQKPEEFYRLIESMYPQFRRVELFARVARPGWAAWGNEIANDALRD